MNRKKVFVKLGFMEVKKETFFLNGGGHKLFELQLVPAEQAEFQLVYGHLKGVVKDHVFSP